MSKCRSTKCHGLSIALAPLVLLTACPSHQETEQPALALTMLCEGSSVQYEAPNSVSFVFKAQTADGDPVVDLQPKDLKIDDGGNTSASVDTDGTIHGLESGSARIEAPVGVRIRTLVLIDGSGSLYAEEELVKKVVTDFVSGSSGQNVVGIYKFYDGTVLGQPAAIVPVYPFSPERDRELYCLEGDALQSAQKADRTAMLSKLAADRVMLSRSSTALYGAIQAAIGELTTNSPPATSSTPVHMNTLVLLTDGRDEVTAGTRAQELRGATIAAATKFRSMQENLILVAGIKRSDQKLDVELLQSIANDYVETSLSPDELAKAFERFSTRAANEGKKFYRFNLCSNRRGQKVDASLIIRGKHGEGTLPFRYDATQFYNGASECNPRAFAKTCPWSAGQALQPDTCPKQ